MKSAYSTHVQPLVVAFSRLHLVCLRFQLLRFLCHSMFLPLASIFLLSLRLHTLLPHCRTLLLHCCPPSSCHVCPFGIHIQEPFSSAPLPYCHASLDRPPFPASYNSLILSTCRSQTSMIPSIRPWARDYSPKVLFSVRVLHPHSSDLADFSCRFVLPLYLVEPTPISCPTPPLLNDDEGRRNCTPSRPKLFPSSQPMQRLYLQVRQIQVCCESQVL